MAWTLWLTLISSLLTIIALLMPVQVRIRLRQNGWEASVDVDVKYGLVRLGRSVKISELVATALEHMLARWRDKGEPVKVPLQKTVRRMPRKKLVRLVKRPLRYLFGRSEFRRLTVSAELGGYDAMQSALLVGASWSLIGTVLGQLSRTFRIDPNTPDITIRPSYGSPAWRITADCILRFRLGNAMVTGIWLLRRLIADREVYAWARDSLRRKGETEDVRPSDTRPDEDGHGEP